jgi:adenylate kinase family enzyme
VTQRIAVIGNGGGGKSTLARALADQLDLPLYEVDAVQWLPGWTRAPIDATTTTLDAWSAADRWIIDGFGPLSAIERRFDRAELIVYVDFPLWRHLWWTAKRQVASYVRGRAWAGQRRPPPNGLMFQTILRVDRMKPMYHELVSRPPRDGKLVHLRSPSEMRRWVRSRSGSAEQVD